MIKYPILNDIFCSIPAFFYIYKRNSISQLFFNKCSQNDYLSYSESLSSPRM